MSLNKTLDRLFDEIRREAKRNADFANRLDAVLRLHDSRRDVPEAVVEDVVAQEAPVPPASSRQKKKAPAAAPETPAGKAVQETTAPALNPAGLYRKGGEEALAAALAGQDLGALRALVAEHNLDPSGVTPSLTRDELATHIIDQAKRRAERDEKMFDY
jgi:hypothetical protein